MAKVKCILGNVVLLTLSVWTEGRVLRSSTEQQRDMTVSEKLELANKDLGGDILTGDSGVFRRVRRNADRCVETDCKWPRSFDGNVYVPYVIDSSYSTSAKLHITFAMMEISDLTCIHFKARTFEEDYLDIQPLQGCRSYIGRQRGAQPLYLNQPNCIYHDVIQHELLHALGFHHEFSRSDRDRHVRVLWENVDEKRKHNFVTVDTLNQGTPYDYNSIMNYDRFMFSKNGQPTLEAVPYPVEFGTATRMSQTDIDRINRLYCSNDHSSTTDDDNSGSGSGSGLDEYYDLYFDDEY